MSRQNLSWQGLAPALDGQRGRCCPCRAAWWPAWVGRGCRRPPRSIRTRTSLRTRATVSLATAENGEQRAGLGRDGPQQSVETPNRASRSTEADPKPVRGGHIRWSGARGARNRPAPLRPAGAGKGPPTAAALASCFASSCWIWAARGGTMPSARVTEVAAPAPRLGATELPNQPICKSTTVSRLHLQGRVQVCGPPTKTSSSSAPGLAEPPKACEEAS